MSRRVVFDVNILISAMLSTTGAPARALASALDQNWAIIRSPQIMARLFEVAGGPHLVARIGGATLNAFAVHFQAYTEVVAPDASIIGIADDAEDDVVLGTAVAGNADVIVTGDKGLLALHPFRGIAILTAREFLDLIDT